MVNSADHQLLAARSPKVFSEPRASSLPLRSGEAPATWYFAISLTAQNTLGLGNEVTEIIILIIIILKLRRHRFVMIIGIHSTRHIDQPNAAQLE